MPSLTLQLKNDLQELSTLAEALKSLESLWGLSAKTVLEVNLILDELCTNCINYAFSEGSNHRIDISINFSDETLTINIQDDGKAFNPLKREEVDTSLPLEERSIGGLGIHLVKQYADSLSYKHQDGKNILIMEKHIGTTSP